MNLIDKYDGFIFDLDGTVYLDDIIISNADIVINTIKSKKKKVIFISNKTTGSIDEYYHFLKSKGINLVQTEIVNATIITKKYLAAHHPNQNFYAIGEKIFIKELLDTGLFYSDNPNEIDVVLITLDRTLNYSKLEIAAKALDTGARFYAANIDNTCPVEDGEILDAGATISALEKRTNRKLEKHFGKPSKYMLDETLSKLDVNPDKCLIIGDRLETDIAMGNEFDIDTALVATGVTKHYDKNGQYHPTYELTSIDALLQ